MRTIQNSQRTSLPSAERMLNSLARKRLNALFDLAPVLSAPQLRKAINLARSVESYARLTELLNLLNEYLARRSKYPATLDRDIRRSRARLKGATRTLPQLLAELAPAKRAALLNTTLHQLQLRVNPPKAKGMSKAVARPRKPPRPKLMKKNGAPVKTHRRLAKKAKGGTKKAGRVLALRPKPPKIGARAKYRPGGGPPPGLGIVVIRTYGPGSPDKWLNLKSVLPMASKKKVATKSKPSKRIVSTGFAVPSQPARPINSNTPLKAGEKYYFWLQVGERVKGTIEVEDKELPIEKLPQKAILDVVLFEVKDGLQLIPGQDKGKLKLVDDDVSVEQQPTTIPLSDVGNDSSLLNQRLFFPVIAPKETGNYRLRCNIYYQTVLVQSRMVNAYVMRRSQTRKNALQSKVDYTLSQSLSVNHISGLHPHRLSIMMNSSGNGTHDFFFFGSKNFEQEKVSFDGQELDDLIEQARNAYALAAWDADNPWKNQNYRYDQSRAQNLQQLEADLVRFAIRGYNIYDAVINRLAGGAKKAEGLAALMRTPGMVQIALKESPSFILPAAIIYDYPLDVDANANKFRLCPTFLQALEAAPALETSECFKGNCPSLDNDTVVCPSGFWGYRHQLGLPLSVAGAPDVPTTITWSNKPIMTVGVSTDPNFKLRDQHLKNLQAMRPAGLGWNYGATREEVIRELKETKPQVVYFYCHGGISKTRPYIQVGAPGEGGNISPSLLRAKKIHWDSPRPLVFINGCHTTALDPELAIQFISPLIENANAAGVIGTEITIFEPIATAFAEECLRRFIDKAPIGEAVRCARLKMLKNGNPLGLVYIPYVMASLSLVEQ